MNELDRLYLDLLYHGLVSLRNASHNGDLELCKAESEYLHEVPSLVGESSRHRHVYQATAARQAFLDWVQRSGREDVRDFIRTWLAPTWKRIDAVLGIEPPRGEDVQPFGT